MTKKTTQEYAENYTKPTLRSQLKEQIKADDKGGPAHKWSARKAQLLKKEYEAQGGDYIHKGHLTQEQKNLKNWSKKH